MECSPVGPFRRLQTRAKCGRGAVPTNSIQSAAAPKERQAAEPARSADAEEQSLSNKTHSRIGPSSAGYLRRILPPGQFFTC
jgi:hypothetical protein